MSSNRNGAAQRAGDSRIPPAPQSGARLRAASGHAHHFLTRLARINRAETELALSLYYDLPLVKTILLLHAPDFTDATKRVAISLDHPKEGPFIIVSCAGRFITCLARGMRVWQHPIVTRKQLDATIARVLDLRAWANVAVQFNRG
jgi:hypothetical protein